MWTLSGPTTVTRFGNQMDEESRWERVPEDSPLRCQAVIPTKGQCLNKKMDGSQYCPAHGGNRAAGKAKAEQLRMYQIDRYQNRLNAMEDHNQFTSLAGEVAVLRMVLETRLKACNTDLDLMLHSQSISSLALSIEKLLNSCERMKRSLEGTLDKNQAMAWIGDVVDIISKNVEDSDVLNQIADELLAAFNERMKKQ